MSDPINPYAAPQVDETTAPRPERASESSPPLQVTAVGLSLLYYGVVLVLLGLVMMFFNGIAARFLGGQAVALLGIGFVAVSVLVGAVLMFAGPLVCLAVPSETGAKGYIIGSVTFQVASLVFTLFAVIFFQPFLPVPPVVFLLSLAWVASTVLFILFVMKLSEYISRHDLATRARRVLIAMLLLVGFIILMAVGAFNDVMPTILGLVMLGALIVFLKYANLINSLRKTLGKS